jgi:hypothetical protein
MDPLENCSLGNSRQLLPTPSADRTYFDLGLAGTVILLLRAIPSPSAGDHTGESYPGEPLQEINELLERFW